MDRELNLFTIDVEAEIRKLSSRRHTTAWEPFVELIRLAASFCPERIDVAISRHRFTLDARRATPNEAVFLSLLRVFDQTLSPDQRQQAISELEGQFGLGILAAFAGTPRRVDLSWRRDGKARGLSFSPTRPPRQFTPTQSSGFALDIHGAGCGSAGQRIIEDRCRYAAVPVTLNGVRVSRGKHLDRCLLWTVIHSSELNGITGIPESGDVTQITRLKHGIVDEETFFPAVRGLVTAAVVEDELEDIHAVNGELRKVGRQLYQKLVDHYPELGAEARRRAESLLFERYEHTRDSRLLSGVEAFAVWGGDAMDFFEVRRRMRQERLFAIDADAPAFLYELEDRLVLVLDKPARRFLEGILEVSLMEPPRRAYFTSLRERFTSLARHVGRWAKTWIHTTGRAIPDSELSPDERRFLDALREAIHTRFVTLPGGADGAVTLSMSEKGTLPWTRLNGRQNGVEYRIPRHHKRVHAMVRAYAVSPAYLYPALVLLSEGREVDAPHFSPFD